MIWCLMFLMVLSSEQKLQVLVSSLNDTKKSSKHSAGCCVHWCSFQHSIVSLMRPSLWGFIAVIMGSMSRFCSWVRPRFSTIVIVSREKHNVSAFTFVAAFSVEKPDKLKLWRSLQRIHLDPAPGNQENAIG